MWESILTLNIVDPPVPVVLNGLAFAALAYLVLRRPTLRWVITVAIAVAVGVLASVLTWLIVVRALNLFGVSLGFANYAWITATLCAIAIGITNLWQSRWWRKVLAALSIVIFLITGTVAINANYGIDRTVAQMLHISQDKPIRLVAPLPKVTTAAEPLWKTWKAPADMPAVGRIGTQVIPNTLSGFKSRPAGIYLPPAALVKNPPALPLVIMMFGQPGDPVPSEPAAYLKTFTARYHGLAPIVIVVDQLGDPLRDPLCLDTKNFGNAETFLTKDVPNWATEHLNVTRNHRDWTIAGYSNGGECAIALAAKHPDIWSNVIDVSGEEYPGSDDPAIVLNDVFHGDHAAYEAQKPVNIMAHRTYPGMTAIFTAGSDDTIYLNEAKRVAEAARQAGMHVTFHEVLNGGHGEHALFPGMVAGFDVLYPVLGLSAPGQ